jgi:hypothetical protein
LLFKRCKVERLESCNVRFVKSKKNTNSDAYGLLI